MKKVKVVSKFVDAKTDKLKISKTPLLAKKKCKVLSAGKMNLK